MAPATSSPRQSSGAPGVSESRWARAEDEPSSAFKGMNRGTRGRGSGSRGRGGRGGGRGGPLRVGKSPADKGGEGAANNISTSRSTPNPAPTHNGAPRGDKSPPTSNNTSTKSKGASRRGSRIITTTQAAKVNNTASVPSSPSAPRPQNRRKRSQSGKATPAVLPKILVQSLDDNSLRPQRKSAGPVPHTAPLKDVPPHLAGASFDVRHDIDALVERVRAAAMGDNRPSTPGSHIDWAGDDDDSLPDLDDWGVSTSPGVGPKAELMSPIVVAGLKPLPGVDENSLLYPASNPPTPMTPDPATSSTSSTSAIYNAPMSAKKVPIHRAPFRGSPRPSPLSRAALDVPLPSPLHKSHSAPGRKRPQPKRKGVAAKEPPTGTPNSGSQPLDKTPEPAADEDQGLAESMHAPKASEPLKDDTRPGLTASTSAPRGTTEPASAPLTQPEHRTHVRAHTVGRPFVHNRPPRGGFSSPRGSPAGALHTRTQSTPTAGPPHRNGHMQRPVLTGDALSRLAKTIGGATAPSTKTPAVTAQIPDRDTYYDLMT